jgi:flagellar hook-basal body complex protein FliE
MSIQGLNPAMEAIRVLAQQASSLQPGNGANVAAAQGFSSELQNSVRRINQLQQSAGASANALQRGDPGVALHEVMVDVQKAGIAFDMGVQVRNKLVNAYKDIMNMPV